MSSSYSETAAFTITHARDIAAKVATDLKRIQRLYGEPSDSTIADFEAEAIALLRAGYIRTVTYGFKRNGAWIEPTLLYTARDLAGANANNDDPGKIRPGANIDGAVFTSFLCYSSAYFSAPQPEREAVKKSLPFQRSSGTEPPINGYLSADRIYSAGGRALDRSSVRSY